VSELEITEAEGKVSIVKSMGVAAPVVMQQVAPVPMVAAPVVAAQVAADTPVVAAVPAGHPVKSPMVGTFYRSSSPGSAPFVQIGSVVKEGDTLCIIEAMKILNEIESDKSGTVTQILCENGQAVEYGQPLFIVE
jgi:acetyl-CoA carboxylase biotin carboxyl carrier protein